MRFPNAHKGISRILTSQWIQLISTILMLVGAVAAVTFLTSAENLQEVSKEAANASTVSAGIGGLIAIAGLVLAIIAFIMELLGLNTARQDESQFNTAFFMCLGGLILAILAAVLQTPFPSIADVLSLVSKIFSLGVIEYCAAGIISLALQLNDQATADLGRKLRILISILYGVAIVLSIFGKKESTFTNIITIADAVVEVIVFIVFIVLLSKAKKMLA